LCHPTTSSNNKSGKNCAVSSGESPNAESNGKAVEDNDLILEKLGAKAYFEVSDVGCDDDGNRKEEKDLISLGFLIKGKGKAKFSIKNWPLGRRFLVVSPQWVDRLNKPSRAWLKKNVNQPAHLRYQKMPFSGKTGIFEVLQGK
jgi:hypothetical protein